MSDHTNTVIANGPNLDYVAPPQIDPRSDAEKAAEERHRVLGHAFDEVWPVLADIDLQLREQGSSLPRILQDLIKATPYKVQF